MRSTEYIYFFLLEIGLTEFFWCHRISSEIIWVTVLNSNFVSIDVCSQSPSSCSRDVIELSSMWLTAGKTSFIERKWRDRVSNCCILVNLMFELVMIDRLSLQISWFYHSQYLLVNVKGRFEGFSVMWVDDSQIALMLEWERRMYIRKDALISGRYERSKMFVYLAGLFRVYDVRWFAKLQLRMNFNSILWGHLQLTWCFGVSFSGSV